MRQRTMVKCEMVAGPYDGDIEEREDIPNDLTFIWEGKTVSYRMHYVSANGPGDVLAVYHHVEM
jgi:hypothetical protein